MDQELRKEVTEAIGYAIDRVCADASFRRHMLLTETLAKLTSAYSKLTGTPVKEIGDRIFEAGLDDEDDEDDEDDDRGATAYERSERFYEDERALNGDAIQALTEYRKARAQLGELMPSLWSHETKTVRAAYVALIEAADTVRKELDSTEYLCVCKGPASECGCDFDMWRQLAGDRFDRCLYQSGKPHTFDSSELLRFVDAFERGDDRAARERVAELLAESEAAA